MKFVRIFTATLAVAGTVAMPAFAQTVLSALEAQERLAGRQFQFTCADGTQGTARYSTSGRATAQYRLPMAPDEQTVLSDRGRVRLSGENVCIRWQKLNAGQEACFRVTERSPGRYRIAENAIRWCDLTVTESLASVRE